MMKPVGLVTGIAVLLAASAAVSRDAASPFDVKLASDRQALHVLNRMAYGPRPGDVEAVRRMGVKQWIQQQLDPAKLPENPALETILKPMVTQTMPTWQLIEATAPPRVQGINLNMPGISQLVPGTNGQILMSNITTPEQRKEVLKSLTPEVRSQVLAQMQQQLVDSIPEYKQEATRARQMRTEMISRQLQDQQRRLSPPLSELLAPDELNVLKHGTDEEKTTLLAAMDPAKRSQVFRGMGPQGAQLLPPVYRRQAALLASPQAGQQQGMGIVNEVIEAKLLRAVLSNRQLEEVLVDFWFNHFNVSASVSNTKVPLRTLIPSYERDAIRPHVLGRFRDMLLATARHPAMLYYLDNYQSQAPRADMLQLQASNPGLRLPGINENYGREIMELHTMGVGSGYTQEDVVNVARAFTGWSIHDVQQVGEFQFNPAYHDRNEKKILGKVFPRGGGESEGVEVVNMLARQPATAKFISRKLAQRFVADDPPPALVERMADTFLRTDGDLRAVMETLLLSKEFMSEGAWRSKVKSPLEMVVSSLRALNAEVTDTSAIAQRLADLGQPLYAKVEPTGYPNTSEAWSNSVGLLGRMNFASALTAGQISGIKTNPEAIAARGVRKAMLALTGIEASPEAIAAVEKGAGGKPPAPALIATALIGSPDFQKR